MILLRLEIDRLADNRGVIVAESVVGLSESETNGRASGVNRSVINISGKIRLNRTETT